MKKCYRIQVTGRVQHVGFRYFTVKEAEKYKINGTVKNVSDGSVLIEAEGESPYIDAFLLVIKKGPSWAFIDQVNVQETPLQNFENFSVKY